MRIAHVAVWTRDLETMRVFYERYFGGRSGEKYVNRAKGFETYMVRLGDTALELMRSARIARPCGAGRKDRLLSHRRFDRQRRAGPGSDRAAEAGRICRFGRAPHDGGRILRKRRGRSGRETAWKSQSEKHGSKKTAHRIHGNARLRGIPGSPSSSRRGITS